MKVCCISDTHGLLPHPGSLPEADLFIHAGDACPSHDHYPEFQSNWINGEFAKWIEKVPARHKVFIAGNHDKVFQLAPNLINLDAIDATYLRDSFVEIEGRKIYGFPWTNWFFGDHWSFNLDHDDPDETDLHKACDLIPGDIDIVISHGPPYGMLDQVRGKEEHLGSRALRKKLEQIKPTISVFGHIHTGHTNHGKQIFQRNGTYYINASLIDEKYRPAYRPVLVTI